METKNEVKVFDKSMLDTFVDNNGKPWFKLADVAKVLEMGESAVRMMKSRDWFDDDETRMSQIVTPSGKQDATYISESALYRILNRSNSPKARPFERWVTKEVLPSIRKHGVYATKSFVEQALADPDSVIQLLQQLKEERLAKEKAEAKILEDKPKVELANAVSSSDTSILIGVLAKLLKQNGVNIGQNRLFSWMRSNGYLTQKNDPTQKAMDMGLFDIHERNVKFGDEQEHLVRTTKVTGKGQVYFINIFLNGDFKNEING